MSTGRAVGRLLGCAIMIAISFPRAGDHPLWFAVRACVCLFVVWAAYDVIRDLFGAKGRQGTAGRESANYGSDSTKGPW